MDAKNRAAVDVSNVTVNSALQILDIYLTS